MAAKPIIMTITNAAKNAMLDGENLGITLRLNRLAIGGGRYNPTGNETALQSEISRHVITAGDIEPNTHTLRLFSVVRANTETEVWELGLYDTENRLFALASATDKPLFKVYPDIDFVGNFALKLDAFDVSNVQVVSDPNGALSITLMSQHLSHSNPHPQYLLRAQYIPEPIKVGGILITTNNYANSQEVHDGEGYGVWTRFGQGKVLAGYSTIANDDARFKTIGNVFEIGSEIENQKAIVAQFWKRLPNDYVAPTFDIYYTSDVEGLNRVSQINEDSAIYLWIDVTNATTPIRVSNFSKQGAGGFISDAANFAYPTTINNGKNLMISVLPENYHVDMQTIIDWGFTLTDNMVDTETDIHSALTINDTISDAPPPPPEPTGRMVFNVYKTGEISDGGSLYKDTIRIECIKNLDDVIYGVYYYAGGSHIQPGDPVNFTYGSYSGGHTRTGGSQQWPSSVTNRFTQITVTQPSIYDGNSGLSIPYFQVTNQSGYAFDIGYDTGNGAQWHTASQSIPIDDSKPFKQIIIDYPAP